MIQLIRLMRDAEYFNTGGGVEQTPIEKAISELKSKSVIGNGDYYSGFESGLNSAIEHLESLLPYEKQHLRSVSEKAWDESYNAVCRTITGRDVEIDEENYEKAKQAYLNQNHPL